MQARFSPLVITPMYVHVRKEIRLSAGHQWHPEDAAVSPGCQWYPEDTVSPGYRGILRIPCPEDTGACPGIRCPKDTAPYPGDMPVSPGCLPCPRTPTRVFRRVVVLAVDIVASAGHFQSMGGAALPANV